MKCLWFIAFDSINNTHLAIRRAHDTSSASCRAHQRPCADAPEDTGADADEATSTRLGTSCPFLYDPDDTLAIGRVVNSLSGEARAYFAAGGLGILIGDGRLNYGSEKIFEANYSIRCNPHWTFALDYQHVDNPAYNKDRGPVSIYAVRVHADL